MDELIRPAPRRSIAEHAVALARWVGVGRIIAVAGAVVAVAVGAVWRAASPSGGSEPAAAGDLSATRPAVPTVPAVGTEPAGDPTVPSGVAPSTTAIVAASTPATVVVHVAGAVAAPGLYELPAAERVGDGGRRRRRRDAPRRRSTRSNLAAPLVDGQQVFVPRLGDGERARRPPGRSAAPSTAPAPVDLNRADAEDLLALPGIGPVTAAAIVRHREEQGPFTSVERLLDVAGIGPARLASLAGLVRV